MKRAFTIVELLTVMSIIIILMSLLVPALNRVKDYSMVVEQRSQFHSIEAGLDMFYSDFGEYPPDGLSRGIGSNNASGTAKMVEALVGQDLLGFHRDSVFRNDFKNKTGTVYLYNFPDIPQSITDTDNPQNLHARMGPYLDVGNCEVARLSEIYGPVFLYDIVVICDPFKKRMLTGERTGMPVLYFKAKAGNSNPHYIDGQWHDANGVLFYNYSSNEAFYSISGDTVPFDSAFEHPMSISGEGEKIFYDAINNYDCRLEAGRPHNQDTYILLSAGPDGLYGTKDDIYNF